LLGWIAGVGGDEPIHYRINGRGSTRWN
jgi:hypothetical protein